MQICRIFLNVICLIPFGSEWKIGMTSPFDPHVWGTLMSMAEAVNLFRRVKIKCHTSCKLWQLLFLDLKCSLTDAYLENISGDFHVVMAKLRIFQANGEESMKLTDPFGPFESDSHPFQQSRPMFSYGSWIRDFLFRSCIILYHLGTCCPRWHSQQSNPRNPQNYQQRQSPNENFRK